MSNNIKMEFGDHILTKQFYEVIAPRIKGLIIDLNSTDSTSGVYIFGAAGVGKSYSIKALLSSIDTPSTIVDRSFATKSQQTAQQNLQYLASVGNQSKQGHILFFDELINYRHFGYFQRILDVLKQLQKKKVLIITSDYQTDKMSDSMLSIFTIRLHMQMPLDEDKRVLLQHLIKQFSKQQIKELVLCSKGLSFSDIICTVRDAQYIPLRQILKSTVWRKTMINEQTRWQPINPQNITQEGQNEQYIQAKFIDLDKKAVFIRQTTFEEFHQTFKKAKSTISQNQLQRQSHLKTQYEKY